MSRACMVTDTDTGNRCLGHPSVDVPWWPDMCDSHLERIFGAYIEHKAEQRANVLLHEMLRGRPRGQRAERPRAVRLRAGAHLTEQDEATLAFLRGVRRIGEGTPNPSENPRETLPRAS